MTLRFLDLWRWGGTISRTAYGFLGVTLFLIKYCLDRFLVRHLTGRVWYPFHYWIPGDFLGLLTKSQESSRAGWALLLTALPFIWVGVTLTLRRLRSAGLPLWLVVNFFIPLVNMLFFIVLMLIPPRPDPAGPTSREFRTFLLGRVIPRSAVGSALAAILLTAAPVGLLILTGASWMGSYGWGLFIGIPFLIGFFSSVLYGYHEARGFGACAGVTALATLMVAGVILLFAMEGAICILMVLPIALALGLFGAAVGYVVQRVRRDAWPRGRTLLSLFVALPLLMGAERATEPEPPLRRVTSAIEVGAPPERVWENVVAFSELAAPSELVFRAGLAYPVRARIDGRGPGAVRHCVFSTGAFVEPIEVWDAPGRLAFRVVAQPPPMEEWSPYPGLHPPHLDGYFVSRRGQFLLEALPGGRTRLEGSTWYTHRLWPELYWGFWSDWIIHRIHLRVLRHVKALSEARGP